MFPSFLASWTKLRRPALLWGTYGALAVISALITTLIFVNAGNPAAAQGGGPPRAVTTLASLAEPGGLLAGLRISVSLIGIVALCVAAAQMAGEYTQGTMRTLLIRRPQRLQLLGGTWGALVIFMTGAVAVAAAVAGGAGLVAAQLKGIDTSAWFSGDGVESSLKSLGEGALAVAGYTTLGAALGSILRAPVVAVAVGIGWLIAIEGILASVIDGISRWLPGSMLTAISSGGTPTVALGAAVLTAAAYLVVAMGVAGALFQRRDITA
ncbi:MAG: type transport system permease protein [Actinomycetota bacterium]|jgi:ABC-type transport system involved in multi-copper enzyme maturation permease subunit|nr:type transport system permease protein [Actinomycetota bacterium]